LAAHHLAVDIVSWDVLAGDLSRAYRAIASGAPPALTTTPSFGQWAQRLAAFGGSHPIEAEAPGWLARVSGAVPLPEDGDGDTNTQATVRVISASLGREETATLLHDAPRRIRARVIEVLATALQIAFERWTGRADLLIDIEGHGREALFDDLDVTRTVGWFTALYPVRLATERNAGVADRLRSVKEALRAAAHGGVGYGLLRYLHAGAWGEALRRAPEAQVVLNYRGESSARTDDLLFRRVTDANVGPALHPDNQRRHLFEISAAVTRGCFEVQVAYSSARHRRDTVQSLVAGVIGALRELLAACREPEAAALSPADFPNARVSGQDLDRLLGRLTGIARR
jgi:non-ribosomal peptide synthase protein (TIGR01720 family)